MRLSWELVSPAARPGEVAISAPTSLEIWQPGLENRRRFWVGWERKRGGVCPAGEAQQGCPAPRDLEPFLLLSPGKGKRGWRLWFLVGMLETNQQK